MRLMTNSMETIWTWQAKTSMPAISSIPYTRAKRIWSSFWPSLVTNSWWKMQHKRRTGDWWKKLRMENWPSSWNLAWICQIYCLMKASTKWTRWPRTEALIELTARFESSESLIDSSKVWLRTRETYTGRDPCSRCITSALDMTFRSNRAWKILTRTTHKSFKMMTLLHQAAKIISMKNSIRLKMSTLRWKD